jgi:hypothetical protein
MSLQGQANLDLPKLTIEIIPHNDQNINVLFYTHILFFSVLKYLILYLFKFFSFFLITYFPQLHFQCYPKSPPHPPPPHAPTHPFPFFGPGVPLYWGRCFSAILYSSGEHSFFSSEPHILIGLFDFLESTFLSLLWFFLKVTLAH